MSTEAVEPVTAESAPEAAAPVAPESFELPAEAKSKVEKLNMESSSIMLRMGALEADYVRTKSVLLRELDARRQAKLDAVSEAAKAANLDMEKTRWSLDEQRMVLVKSA